jgi:hypothetical protein
MAPKLDETTVIGRWLHAFEEDEPGQTVYRPATWPFPPSRRPRAGFDLEPDGVAVEQEPGPADARVGRPGRWRLDAAGHLCIHIHGRPERRLEIESVTASRLVLRTGRRPNDMKGENHGGA